MRTLSRRSFLKVAGIGAASLAVNLGSLRPAAAAWGDIPSSFWPAGVAPRQYKVLEIFLYGGLSPWETFYVRPTLTDPWRGFANEINALVWGCTGAPAPATETRFFANDPGGLPVHLGPMTKPLWRADIVNRMRIIVLQHELEPHEAAVPFALTGHRLGRPQLAGMGSAVQRRFMEVNRRSLPYSYVCVPQVFSFPNDNLQATTAVGRHPGTARPLALRIGSGTDDLTPMLARANMPTTANALINQYRAQYRDQLRWRGAGEPIRSKGFLAYDASATALVDAASLRGLLASAPLTLRQDTPCPSFPAPNPALDNTPGTAIRVAAHLLTRPDAEAARYVCVVDSGLEEHPSGGGYDTHNHDHVIFTAVNLWNTLSTLAELIRVPGSGDLSKLDLDETLIILTTEFGRTWDRHGDGRDHWPQGYVNVLIGGPISAPRIAGAIQADGGVAASSFSPADVRAAALLAASVNPFEDDNFGVGDLSSAVQDGSSEAGTSVKLFREVLGVGGGA